MKVPPRSTCRQDGVALVLILAFLVLLTVVVVAFFSRAITARQVSSSSAAQTGADTLARSAANTIIADLKQEIVAGSTAYTPISGVTIYTPTADPTGAAAPPVLTSSVVPWVSGAPTPATAGGAPPIPNLLRRSARAGDATVVAYPTYYASPPPNRASAVNSYTDVSANGRSVSPAQWNAHYLIPMASPSASPASSTPVSSFVTPDWVIVTKEEGPAVLSTPTKDATGNTVTAIGRFAYAVYDEGGLLDANVAGCPSTVTSTATLAAAKGFAAFADLTAVGLHDPTLSPGSTGYYQMADNFVGWRNYATTQPSGSLAAGNYSFSNTSATNYFNYILGQSTGFLTINTNTYAAGTGNTAGTYSSTGTMTFGSPAQMDQVFANRQSLIKFWTAAGFPASSLQYFGTFTRDLNRPNFVPLANPLPPAGLEPGVIINYPVPTQSNSNPAQAPIPVAPTGLNPPIEPNPIVQNVFVTSGTNKGAPIIAQRFPLSKIALLANPTANKAAILHYFGLTAVDAYSWTYSHPDPTGVVKTPAGTIMSLAQVASMSGPREAGYPQEPDFFEDLQAAVLYGSMGNLSMSSGNSSLILTAPNSGYAAAPTGYTITGNISGVFGGNGFNATTEPSQFCTGIIQMGANIIDQYDTDNLPTVITFNKVTYAGIENLPYLSELLIWPYRPKTTIPANTPQGNPVGDPDQLNLAGFLMIELWNPHQNASSVGLSTSGTSPVQLRFGIQPSGYQTSPVAAGLSVPIYTPPSTNQGIFAYPAAQISTTELDVNFSNSPDFQEPTLLGSAYNATSPQNDWYQVTDSTPSRSGLLLGVKLLPDYYVAKNNGDPLYNTYSTYPTMDWGDAPKPTFFLQFSPDGTSWYNYEGTTAPMVASAPLPPFQILYQAGITEGQMATTINKPSPFGPQITNDVSFSVYNNIGARSVQVPDPRTRSNGSLFVGQSTYGMSIRPGTSGTGGNIGGAQIARYQINEPPNYTFPIYGSNYNFTDYNLNSSKAYAGMYNENADNNTSNRHLVNKYIAANASAVNTYLIDPDGVMRPGDGFYGGNPYVSNVPSNTAGAASVASRPILLNRPFRSVGEMGYADRGWGVWKSINFFSQESADAGLLDYFSIDQASISAGKINLNTRQPMVLQAILQGAYRIEPVGSAAVDTLTSNDANNIATAIVNHTSMTAAPAQTPPPYIPGPFVSRADLVRSLMGDPAIAGTNGVLNTIQGTTGTTSTNTAKTRREALVRALADVGTTRTWNLLIDIVAQAGSYPANATGLSNFVVTGEKHYWLHVALDRYTGAIIDQQMELVNE